MLLVDQSAHLLDDVRFAAESGPGDRSVGRSRTARWERVTRRGHERLTGLPVVRRLVQQAADAAATGYRPLRLNSSRCASNQAMTSLRFQRLCLPIL